MKRITLTRKGFREWLEGKPGEEVVGHPMEAECCPVARYLQRLGAGDARVQKLIVETGGGLYPETQPLPLWAMRFVRTIDNDGVYDTTARQALAVLEGKEQTDA